ncbi:MAG: tape measure protein [Xanthobacteraceae bacterium]
MADDAGERLVVMLEARITDFEKRMKQAERTGTRSYTQLAAGSSRATRNMERDMLRSTATINRSLAQTSTQIGSFAKAFAVGIAGSAAFKAFSSASQQFTKLQNSLKVTGLEGDALNKTFGSLFQIAQKNGTAIEPLVTLYSRAAQAQKELNANSADLLKFTDGISLALRVAGTDSTQAAGALLQLSQAIGSGVVRAEEFNSVNEGARPILQAVAAGLKEAGGSVSTLKNLVNDGKVSSEAFFRAFLAGMPMLEAQAAKAEGTIGQANERISNAFLVLVGHLDKTTGASKNAAQNLNALGGVLEGLPGYFDAALKKLEAFQNYLTKLGNNPTWLKIAKFMGADVPERVPGGPVPDLEEFQKRTQIDRLSRNIEDEQARLADIIGNTMVRADQRTIKTIEDSIAGMKAERDRLQQTLAKTSNTGPGGRIAEGARDPLGQAPAKEPVKPVSLKDFKLPGKKDGSGADTDAFKRSTDQIAKRIELMKVEASTIDMTAEAQARARTVVELETAAKRANEQAGKKNTEVTEEQRVKINALADAYAKAKGQLEQLHGPLATFARESANVGKQLEGVAVQSLDRFADEFADVVTGTKSVADAFKSMSTMIISELAKIAIKKAILGPLASLMGGIGGGVGMPLNILPAIHHGGYGPGDSYPTRSVTAATFRNAERLHSGVGPGERAAIIRKDESVLTPGQMRQLALVSQQPAQPSVTNHITVDVRGATGNAEVQKMVAAGMQVAYKRAIADAPRAVIDHQMRRM